MGDRRRAGQTRSAGVCREGVILRCVVVEFVVEFVVCRDEQTVRRNSEAGAMEKGEDTGKSSETGFGGKSLMSSVESRKGK